jgi:rSAM/selenodomain-associated transferase 2/rSAM/selenodomain-associated transferase 1
VSEGTRIVILAKPPRPGLCKSRLAVDIGQGAAARLARAFLIDVWAAVSAFVSARSEVDLVFAQSGEPDEYPLLVPTPAVVRQGDGDLGRRMATLTAGALSQRDRALLLGTDSPGLPDEHLSAALAAQDDADIVLGPLEDGGFWCLGVRKGHQSLWGNTWLDDLDWTVDATRTAVEERARRLGLSVAFAPTWFDVDRVADLDRLRGVLWADEDRAPETRAMLATLGRPEPMSIIVAALNESVGLDYCLEELAEQPGDLEFLVADGGSTDRSAERAAGSGAVVVTTAPGRGRQLAAGARLATGDVLLFLHADARLPPGGTRMIREALADRTDGTVEAGAFVTHTVADDSLRNWAGPLLRLADIRSRLTRHPYGDQGIFVTREAYEAVDGFRDLPIMEDYDLSVRLAARHRLARIRVPVRVSGRRFQRHPLRSMLLMRVIPPLFRLGVSPDALARLYRRW